MAMPLPKLRSACVCVLYVCASHAMEAAAWQRPLARTHTTAAPFHSIPPELVTLGTTVAVDVDTRLKMATQAPNSKEFVRAVEWETKS